MANILLKDMQGNAIQYDNVNTIKIPSTDGGEVLFKIDTGQEKEDGVLLKTLLDNIKSCKGMFQNGDYIIDLRGCIGPNDTENVEDMENMFQNCGNLEYVPHLNTKNVSSAHNMFEYCYNLKRVDFSHLPCGEYMFYDCHALKDIIIRNYKYQTFEAESLANCYHFNGTQDDDHNPDGLKDGRIYVPSSEIDNFKRIVRNSYNIGVNLNADEVVRPIYSVATPTNGEIDQVINENNEVILTAMPYDEYNFIGWYNGEYIMPGNVSGQVIEGQSPDDEEYPWSYDDEFEMYVNGNRYESDTVSCIRFNFTVTEPDQRLKITYYQNAANPNFGCIGQVDEEYDSYNTGGDVLYDISMSDMYEEREVVYRDNLSLGDHFIDIKFAYNLYNSSTAMFMVKVELVSAGGSQVLVGELYSTEPEINIGVVDEQTMDPLNLIAVFDGESSDEPDEPDPDEPEDPDEPDEPDVSGPPEIRISTNGSPNAYYGISYSTDNGQSWQPFPIYTFDDFHAAEDVGYIVVLEDIDQIKFRVAQWYSLDCEDLGIFIYNEETQYEYSLNCVLDGPVTLYAEQLD